MSVPYELVIISPACVLFLYCEYYKKGMTRNWIQNADQNDAKPYFKAYCHVSGVCVINTMGFGYDVRIYWVFIKLVTTVHTSLSDRTLHWDYSDFQLNCQLLLASCYIASGQTTAQATHLLSSNGYM
jgi:hypothetical protein